MSRRHPAVPPILVLALSVWLAACGGGGGGGSPTGASPPLISSFSPISGAVGTQVTISGLRFEPGPGGTSLRFHGAPATVLSASTTSLVALVPAGATTGRIEVTTAGGTATSSTDFTVLTGLGAAWTTRLAGPRGTQSGLAWTGTRFAAVGSGAGFQASPDALVWTMTSQLATASDVAWDGSLLVAVGNSGVRTSSDGLTWTLRTASGARSGVARSPGAWVTVGSGGTISSSPDANGWTPRTSGTTRALHSVTWTGSRFVAVGEDGAVVTSPDGAAWTLQAPPTTDTFTAVGSSPSIVVATTFPYPGSQSALLTSPDGATWTPRVPGIAPFNRVVHAGGQFVGLGFYTAATSTDGVAWTTAAGLPGVPSAVVHTGAGWVATGSDGNGASAVFTSSDGLAWSMRAADHDLVALARRPSDGLLVTVGSNTARTSGDGGASWTLDWLSPSLNENYLFLDLVWSPTASAFIALVLVGANQDAYRSSDGRSWTRIGAVPCLGGLAVSDAGLLLVTGSSLIGACVASSPDGTAWTPGTPPAGGLLRKAFWTGSQFLAVGSSGALATSPDGASWTPRASGVTVGLRGAATSPSTQVVVGDGGTILTSGDGGTTWSPRTSGTAFNLRRVTWTGSEFLAVGSSGRLLRSPDGVAWTTQPTPYSSSPDSFNLNEVAWAPAGGGRLVLVGSNGLVATSGLP
jgi:IPT/TIG domain